MSNVDPELVVDSTLAAVDGAGGVALSTFWALAGAGGQIANVAKIVLTSPRSVGRHRVAVPARWPMEVSRAVSLFIALPPTRPEKPCRQPLHIARLESRISV